MKKSIFLTSLALIIALIVSNGAFATTVNGGVSTLDPADLDAIKSQRATYVRFNLAWGWVEYAGKGTFDWTDMDTMVNGILSRGLTPVAVVHITPTWAAISACAGDAVCEPQNASDYGDFVVAAATRYPQIRIWEIWNEPNITPFWKPLPNPVKYTALLINAYSRLKAINSNNIVLAGAFSPGFGYVGDPNEVSPTNYLTAMYANGAGGDFDAVSHHPYCYDDLRCPNFYSDYSAWSQMADTSPSLRSIMIANGDTAKKIWVTEFGAPTGGTDSPNIWTQQQQADTITKAFDLFRSYDWAGPLLNIHNARDKCNDSGNKECFFGMRDYSGANKLSYLAFLNANAPAAFPGAQGGGASATGGRGGAVVQVTNLNDSGAGSLRACLTASGDRTCVFTVGGTINLLSEIYINSPGGLTVAGQTAPGDGIQISGKNFTSGSGSLIVIANPNMIFRYLRIRRGYNALCAGGAQCGGTFNMSVRVQNVILDHISQSWNQDDGAAPWGIVNNVTIQHSIFSEGLSPHATGVITGGKSDASITNVDLHHNFFTGHSHRAPFLGHASGREVNDIVYNASSHMAQLYGCIQYDGISNIRKRGPKSGTAFYEMEGLALSSGTDACNGSPSMYLSGNIGWNQTNPAGDQWAMARQVSSYNGPPTAVIPAGWRRVTPLSNTTYPITAESVTTLTASLLPTVGDYRQLNCDGTWRATRDTNDTRLVNEFNTGTGITASITNESQVGGFPVIKSGTPCSDKDKDGMPDIWEEARGYNPNSPANRNTVAANGYTYLENYLNGQ